ncbi:hypothetical protein AKJ38_01495 [candidate division MSBL1 archaeon SCGC-AAA259I14]|uniref:HD Cas3-type domain-containing protein n=1 Tax=candidate division MSBL1 archaeon SCGC-AAA259I14 TaxID=1698268 RepID=A0A133UT95_9EURY|nr:hypothetical protein AKJ38_01495 [candidate division MSBL1 archaeon SCGC-AAA259I14]
MIEELIEESTLKILGEKRRVLAHRIDEKEESLSEHAEKTRTVLNYLIEENEKPIRTLYNSLSADNGLEVNYQEFLTILLRLGEFHDVGKFNPIFQREKLDNDDFADMEIPSGLELSSQHSFVSSIFYLLHLYRNYNLEENMPLLSLPFIVQGHHTRVKNIHEGEYGIVSLGQNEKFSNHLETFFYLCSLLEDYQDEDIQKDLNKLRDLYKKFFKALSSQSANLSFFYNYIYSLLIKADFISSSYSSKPLTELENDLEKFDDGIDSKLFSEMKEGFEEKQKEFEEKTDESTLNPVRKEMFTEAMGRLEEGLENDKSVFYLNMPTGGGKTHTALGLALSLIKQTENDRIIYSLPHTSLLEQNYGYLSDVLDVDTVNDIRTIYSQTDISPDLEEEYLEKVLTHDDFFNYPIICTTSVSLLNSIIKFGISDKYRFSSLANSVIILDEVQTFPAEYWPEFNYLLNELSEKLNSHIIIMSATVPSLERLKSTRNQDPKYQKDVHYLIKDTENYHKKFERNEIINGIKKINLSEKESLDKLTNYLEDVSWGNFEQNKNHGLIVLNTDERSREVYEELSKKFKNVDTFLLNSTVLPSIKKEIVKMISETYEGDELILVGTQSIEAGMDLSFNFVFRDLSTLESIEQVRGRCNRELEFEKGNVYLMEVKQGDKADSEKIYQDWRLEETEKILKETKMEYDIRDIEKYFDNYIQRINEEISKKIKLNATENINKWNKMKFEEKDNQQNEHKNVFQVDLMPENVNTFTFFVEIELDKSHFTEDELQHLSSLEKEENGYELMSDGKVDGGKILSIYRKELEEIESEYSERKILKKPFSSILSKFTFSSTVPVDQKEIEKHLEKEGPYYVIPNQLVEEDGLYSFEKGLNRKFFQKDDR